MINILSFFCCSGRLALQPGARRRGEEGDSGRIWSNAGKAGRSVCKCPEFHCGIGLGRLINAVLWRWCGRNASQGWGAGIWKIVVNLCGAKLSSHLPPRRSFPVAACCVDAGRFRCAWACLGRGCELIGGTEYKC